MKYAIKITSCCPEGAVTGINYWVAKTEAEMERIITADFGGYCYVNCLGPITEPADWQQKIIAKESV